MKKILLFIQLFIAVCLTACYTNVITDYEGGGGGGNPSNQFITLSDPAQLNQTAYADSPSCEITQICPERLNCKWGFSLGGK